MKKQTFYICSRCDKQFPDEAECVEHELRHGAPITLRVGDVVNVAPTGRRLVWAIVTETHEGGSCTFNELYFGYPKLSDQSGGGFTISEFTITHVIPREDVLELEQTVSVFMMDYKSRRRPPSFTVYYRVEYDVQDNKQGVRLIASVQPTYLSASFQTKNFYPRLDQ